MSSVWIIVQNQSVTHGHGSVGNCKVVATTDPYNSGPPFPAFLSEESARSFLKNLAWNFLLDVLEIQVAPLE